MSTTAAPLVAAPDAPQPADVYSALINIAGRQRMLSQRITLFALLALRGDGNALPVAQESVVLFRSSHATLTKGRDGLPAPFNDELREAFFGPQGVDTPVTTFIRIAEETLAAIARMSPTAERRVQTLAAQATPMLSLLNRVMQIYERQARAQAQAQRDRQGALMGRIKDIAGEARIAGLSAHMIAARAGRHGRDFAVVANILTGISDQIDTLSSPAPRPSLLENVGLAAGSSENWKSARLCRTDA